MDNLIGRARELFDMVFGEGRVEIKLHPDNDPLTVEVGDGSIWLSSPNEDCDKWVWGTATPIPATRHSPPDCDVVGLGEARHPDEAIKAVVGLYAEYLVGCRLDREADEAYDEAMANGAEG